jgi:hypothetical protein
MKGMEASTGISRFAAARQDRNFRGERLRPRIGLRIVLLSELTPGSMVRLNSSVLAAFSVVRHDTPDSVSSALTVLFATRDDVRELLAFQLPLAYTPEPALLRRG